MHSVAKYSSERIFFEKKLSLDATFWTSNRLAQRKWEKKKNPSIEVESRLAWNLFSSPYSVFSESLQYTPIEKNCPLPLEGRNFWVQNSEKSRFYPISSIFLSSTLPLLFPSPYGEIRCFISSSAEMLSDGEKWIPLRERKGKKCEREGGGNSVSFFANKIPVKTWSQSTPCSPFSSPHSTLHNGKTGRILDLDWKNRQGITRIRFFKFLCISIFSKEEGEESCLPPEHLEAPLALRQKSQWWNRKIQEKQETRTFYRNPERRWIIGRNNASLPSPRKKNPSFKKNGSYFSPSSSKWTKPN